MSSPCYPTLDPCRVHAAAPIPLCATSLRLELHPDSALTAGDDVRLVVRHSRIANSITGTVVDDGGALYAQYTPTSNLRHDVLRSLLMAGTKAYLAVQYLGNAQPLAAGSHPDGSQAILAGVVRCANTTDNTWTV
jgi:hypothetical protein